MQSAKCTPRTLIADTCSSVAGTVCGSCIGGMIRVTLSHWLAWCNVMYSMWSKVKSRLSNQSGLLRKLAQKERKA